MRPISGTAGQSVTEVAAFGDVCSNFTKTKSTSNLAERTLSILEPMVNRELMGDGLLCHSDVGFLRGVALETVGWPLMT